MKILSWNIYFDDESGVERYPKICEIIKNSDFDIICLQEVTQNFLKNIDISGYYTSEVCNESRYQNIILSKKNVIKRGTLKLTSDMGRVAPYIELEDNLVIYSVHLESMLEDTLKRIKQLDELMNSLERENTIICGDMNFGDDDLEQDFVRNNFIDVGIVDKGFTFDIIKNEMAKINRFEGESSRRLDRFFIKGDLSYSEYKVIDTFESDHFPISVKINI